MFLVWNEDDKAHCAEEDKVNQLYLQAAKRSKLPSPDQGILGSVSGVGDTLLPSYRYVIIFTKFHLPSYTYTC